MSTTVNTSDNNVSITQDTQTLTITDNSAGTSVDVNTTSTNAVTITDKNQFIYTANDSLVVGDVTASSISNVNTTHVTASGNISASGDIIGGGDITAHGNIQTYGDIILEDSIAGGAGKIRAQFDDFAFDDVFATFRSQNSMVLGHGSRGMSITGSTILIEVSDAQSGNVTYVTQLQHRFYFGTQGQISDPILFEEGCMDVPGNITASGNISASIGVYGGNIYSNNKLVALYAPASNINLLSDSTTKTLIQGINIDLNSPVTASIISASGDVFAEEGRFDNDVWIGNGQVGDNTSPRLRLHNPNTEHIYIDWEGGDLHYRYDTTTKISFSPEGTITASGNLKIDGTQVDFSNLPTSDPEVAGRLWNDNNTIKISAG
jgi:hypothetical protein